MKGLVLVERDKLEMRCDLPEPKCGPFDAIIKPYVVAPCTSDIHIMHTPEALPGCLGKAIGHEVCGHVIEVGSEVKDFKVGDRVAVGAAMNNFRTKEAQAGYSRAHNMSVYGQAYEWQQGAFAEKYFIYDADMNLARIPDEISWEQAVMLTDMAATSFEGVRNANIRFGDSVAVIGIGAVGLMAIAASALQGAGRIFAVGSRQMTFDLAKEYGATDFISYKDGDIVAQIVAANGGPVDSAIVCGGRDTGTVDQALFMTKQNGTVINLASFMGEAAKPLNYYGFLMDKTFKSVLVDVNRDVLERLMVLVQCGRLAPEKLVTHKLNGLENVETALMMMDGGNRDCIKPVVYFEQ